MKAMVLREISSIEKEPLQMVDLAVPGYEIVGKVERLGSKVTKFRKGDRVGIAWINFSCGECSFCREEKEEGL